jgi:hypothetical protein
MTFNPDGRRLQIRVRGHKRSALYDERARVVRIYDCGVWIARDAANYQVARDVTRSYFEARPESSGQPFTSLTE